VYPLPIHEKEGQGPSLVPNVCCVTGRDLPNNAPIANVTKVPPTNLPSVEECNHTGEEFGVLTARVIVEKMEYFSRLKPVVPEHMKHK